MQGIHSKTTCKRYWSILSLKQTVRTWNSGVGRWVSFWGPASFQVRTVTPRKMNGWNIQITHLERKMIFQTPMIMFHVHLPGCSSGECQLLVFQPGGFRIVPCWEDLIHPCGSHAEPTREQVEHLRHGVKGGTPENMEGEQFEEKTI